MSDSVKKRGGGSEAAGRARAGIDRHPRFRNIPNLDQLLVVHIPSTSEPLKRDRPFSLYVSRPDIRQKAYSNPG